MHPGLFVGGAAQVKVSLGVLPADVAGDRAASRPAERRIPASRECV